MVLHHGFKNKTKSKIKDVIIQSVPTLVYKEVLLNNVLEKDLQSVLKPLDLMQRLFICAKYSIQDNFITSNSSGYNLLGFVCAILFRSLILYHTIDSFSRWDATFTLYLCSIYDFVFFSIGFIINYYSNIIHNDNHVVLILKIQHVHRVLKMDRKLLTSLVISNWIFVVILNCLYAIDNLNFSLKFSISILDLMSNYSSICFDINIVYASFFIILLRKTLSVWIKDIQISGNDEDLNSESHWKIMFDVYSNILAAYKIFEKTFRLLVVYHTIHTVCHGLMTVAILLQMKQIIPSSDGEFAQFAILSQMWQLKSMALQMWLCVESEKFYSTMDELPSTCILLMNTRGCSDAQRRVCKNIQRMQKASFKKMNEFGLFVVDGTLPLRISGVTTTYTLALLQFMIHSSN